MRSRRPARAAGAEPSTDLDAAREAALKLLERIRRTRADLARRLRDRGFSAATIDQALDRLAGVGLVDDVEYASAFLRGRLGRRPAGRRRLEYELRARGLEPSDIAQAFERIAEDEPLGGGEVEGARRVVALAEHRYRALEPRVRRQRLYALLARRGFDRDTIEAALGAARSEGD